MKLFELLEQSEVQVEVAAQVDLDMPVCAVTADSRRVAAGTIFVAVEGARSDGLAFVAEAVEAGAVAVVTDRPFHTEAVPVLRVSNARDALGRLAAALHGQPSRAMALIGVTGTNGKTTTTILMAQLLNAAGKRAAALGTTGLWTPEGTRPMAMTTPDAETLQQTLAELRREGFSHVALEVSSHALEQHRVAGTRFAATVWTNLTRDHLDYHGTLEAYAAAKALLFGAELRAAHAFVNADDDAAAAIWHQGRAEAWSLGAHGAAEHQVAQLRLTAQGLDFVLQSRGKPPLAVTAPLIGRHNAENLAAALLVCRALGASEAELVAGCAHLVAPRGRLQPIPNDLGALVLVDYAHTPDALQQVLTALRPFVAPGHGGQGLGDAETARRSAPLPKGRLIVLFGCGGDRDPGKRPLMGQVAARLADLCLVTSDNPRTEEPLAILAAIQEGLRMTGAQHLDKLVPSTLAHLATGPRRCGYVLEPDREQAIRRAVGLLHAGDVLVIAGKGHETVQVLGSEERPFDDAAVAAGFLRLNRGSAESKAAPPAAVGAEALAPRPGGFAFDGATALQAAGGRLLVASPRWTTELCTDSRKLAAGALFVALPGEMFDGGDFVRAALGAGAVGVVAAAARAAEFADATRAAGAWLLAVDDPLLALGELARDHRQRHAPLVVGITGSNGKTTTKELTALALAPMGAVLKTAGNFNNRIGLPLTLAGLGPQHRVAVLEMGMSIPGEIAQLTHIARQRIGVVTSIAEAHLLGMGSIRAIAREKADVLLSLPADGVAVVPDDEPLLQAVVAQLACRVLRFGRSGGDVRLASPIVVEGLGQRFTADVGGTLVDVVLPGLGVHLAHNALAALAVALGAGADLHAAAAALAQYQPVGQRMLPSRIGPWLVLEDCYNANPRSVEVALETLATLPAPRAALLGSMLELGADEKALHARVGRHAARLGLDVLIAVGPFAADYARGAAEGGLFAQTAADPAEAAAAFAACLPTAATLLVKGSRGARMERAIAALSALTPTLNPAPLAPARS